MTDNEIIKVDVQRYTDALSEILGADVAYFQGDKEVDALVEVIGLALKLEKEVERLEAMIDAAEEHFAPLPFKNKFDEYIEKAKTEVIKEFAERLNKEAEKVCIDREGDFVEADGEIYDTVADWCKETIDNLVKEMVGE